MDEMIKNNVTVQMSVAYTKHYDDNTTAVRYYDNVETIEFLPVENIVRLMYVKNGNDVFVTFSISDLRSIGLM